MSRSNGPLVPPGGVPARPARQLNQALPPLPGAQPPGPPPAPPAASDQLSQVAYRQPQQQRQQGYAPQFDAYVPPSQPPAPPAYVPPPPPPQTYAQPQGYDHHAQAAPSYPPQQPTYAQPAAPQARASMPAYDQWAPPAAPAPDPRGYDMGGYAPQNEPAAYQQPQYDPYQAQQAQPPMQVQAEWPQHAHQQQYAPQAHEPSLDASGYRQDPQQQSYQQPQASGLESGAEFGEDEEYETEEAPRGRYMRIAAALVGAIVVGGGIAYAYTSIMTPDNGKPPVIKSAGPTKIKPADPGGKKFANTDSKLMGRLNDGSSAEDPTGVKKVATVKVGSDGSIIPPAEMPADPAATVATATPAASDDDGFPGAGTTLGAPAVPPPPPPPVQADSPLTVAPPTAPDIPVKVDVALPDTVKSAVSPTTTNSITAAAAATKPLAPPPAVKKVAAAAPAVVAPKKAPPVAVAAPVSTGAGYVAVLASVPVSNTSRIAALKQFADMQQKYSGVLQDKSPDVRETNLGEKGLYHRLLVGPPGSREGAQALCGSLKAAGYAQSCWVTAY